MAGKTMQDVAEFLKAMKFQKKLLGGVSEADVWRRLELLDEQYRAVFEAQRIRYETLLEERDREILRLKEQNGAAPVTAQGSEV